MNGRILSLGGMCAVFAALGAAGCDGEKRAAPAPNPAPTSAPAAEHPSSAVKPELRDQAVVDAGVGMAGVDAVAARASDAGAAARDAGAAAEVKPAGPVVHQVAIPKGGTFKFNLPCETKAKLEGAPGVFTLKKAARLLTLTAAAKPGKAELAVACEDGTALQYLVEVK